MKRAVFPSAAKRSASLKAFVSFPIPLPLVLTDAPCAPRLAMPEKRGPLLRALRPFGIWFGRRTVYLPKLLRPDAAALLTLLWGVWTRKDAPPAAPAPGLTSFELDKDFDPGALHPAGFAAV